MGYRFQHAEEHQADTDTRREQHRQPPGITVTRFRIGATEPHSAELRHGDTEPEHHEDVRGNHEEPVESRRYPDSQVAENNGCLVLEQHRHDDECH